MKPILIQGAENSEINYFLQKLENKNEIEIGSFKFWRGTFNNYPIIISRTKVGEINGAIATTIGIEEFDPICIINQGTAGSHSKNIHRGDIVIAKNYVYLTTFLTEARDEGIEIGNWKLKKYNSDDDAIISEESNLELVEFSNKLKDEYFKGKIYVGTIGSGDIWNREIDRINFLNSEYGTLCEDMETAGVYKTANSFGVPVVGIRIVSNNEILKEEYKPEISTDCQIFVEKVVKNLIKKYKER